LHHLRVTSIGLVPVAGQSRAIRAQVPWLIYSQRNKVFYIKYIIADMERSADVAIGGKGQAFLARKIEITEPYLGI
jgi:hypothetical protein